MSYVSIKAINPIAVLNNEDGEVNFNYKSSLQADLGQSFGRIFLKFTDGNDQPIQFGDWLHINDMMTDSLWKNVRIHDYQNNIDIQSSAQSHLQSIVNDILQPDENNIGGITSNSSLSINTYTGTMNDQNSLFIDFDRFDRITTPLDLSIGHNIDDLNQHTYARWGETLEPFPLPTSNTTGAGLVTSSNNLILAVKNKAGLTRLKRQFMFGWNKAGQTDAEKTSNTMPYLYKPHWNDMFDGRKSYLTNNININLVRGSILNTVQYQSNIDANSRFPPAQTDLSWILGSSARKGVKCIIEDFDFMMYVIASPTKSPRTMIWTSDLRTHVIDSPYFNRKELISGPYDFCVLLFTKQKNYSSLYNNKGTEVCHYKSGLSLKLLNNNTNPSVDPNSDIPTLPLTDMTFFVDHGTDIVQIPSTERYRVLDYTEGNVNLTQVRLDLIVPYIEYLKACGLNPFDLTQNRAKVDFNSFVSQMLYVPVSMRKDRKYWSNEPQAVTVLGCEMNFNTARFAVNEANNVKFTLNVCGFRKVFI